MASKSIASPKSKALNQKAAGVKAKQQIYLEIKRLKNSGLF
jgi:hypothetical protein